MSLNSCSHSHNRQYFRAGLYCPASLAHSLAHSLSLDYLVSLLPKCASHTPDDLAVVFLLAVSFQRETTNFHQTCLTAFSCGEKDSTNILSLLTRARRDALVCIRISLCSRMSFTEKLNSFTEWSFTLFLYLFFLFLSSTLSIALTAWIIRWKMKEREREIEKKERPPLGQRDTSEFNFARRSVNVALPSDTFTLYSFLLHWLHWLMTQKAAAGDIQFNCCTCSTSRRRRWTESNEKSSFSRKLRKFNQVPAVDRPRQSGDKSKITLAQRDDHIVHSIRLTMSDV